MSHALRMWSSRTDEAIGLACLPLPVIESPGDDPDEEPLSSTARPLSEVRQARLVPWIVVTS